MKSRGDDTPKLKRLAYLCYDNKERDLFARREKLRFFFERNEGRKGFLLEGCFFSGKAGNDRCHDGFSFLWLEPKKRNKESSRADTSFAKNGTPLTEGPELAPYRSSNSVAFRAFAPYHFLNALSLRPGVPYVVAGVFQSPVGSGLYSFLLSFVLLFGIYFCHVRRVPQPAYIIKMNTMALLSIRFRKAPAISYGTQGLGR